MMWQWVGSPAFTFVFDEGCSGGVWVSGHDYPTLAWPKRGHSPGGSTTAATVVGMVVVGTEMVVAAFEPHLPDLARRGPPVPNE